MSTPRSTPAPAGPIRPDPDDPGSCLVLIKVVPGARRDELAGPLGDRLKVRVSAPPEDGRANAAVLALLAQAAGVAPRSVELISGHAQPTKTIRLRGISPADAHHRLLPGP